MTEKFLISLKITFQSKNNTVARQILEKKYLFSWKTMYCIDKYNNFPNFLEISS